MPTFNNTLVTFQGNRYIWLKHEDNSGALAYPDHVDDDGEIHLGACFLDSFAHVFGGKILRYGEVIGSIEDLQFNDQPAKQTA